MDGTLFTILTFPNPSKVTVDDYISYLNTTFGATFAPSILDVYPISMFNSTRWPAFYAISAVLTDAEYTCPTRRALVTSLSSQLGTYAYLWNHQPSCSWITSLPTSALPLLGPTHTSEIPFVFGETTQLPRPNGMCQMTADEQVLSLDIITAWQSMSQYGYPAFGNGIQWTDWSQGGIGVHFTGNIIFDIVNATQCDFWDALLLNNSTNSTSVNTSHFPRMLGVQLISLVMLQLSLP
jgi:carboxylesterase type B